MDGMKARFRYTLLMGLCALVVSCQSPTTQNEASGGLDSLENNASSAAEDVSSSESSSDDLFSEMEGVGSGELPPPPEAPLPSAPAESAIGEVPPPAEVSPPAPTDSVPEAAQIQALDYKAHQNGGTIVIQGSKPLRFTTRKNANINQFVIEISDAILPMRLQRPLLAKDIPGAVGAVQAYQSATSKNANVIIQLRPGAAEPVVQAEGNSLLVLMQAREGSMDMLSENRPTMVEPGSNALLSSASLKDFLRANSRFYGKKISIEFDDIELRDVFKLITEEAGINMIVADDVKGKMSLKLREVPWDQALVLILKSRKLGYTRSGNVLRIANMNEIRLEEEDAVKAAQAIKDTAPLKVRLIPISYAPVADVEKQVKPFLSKRGSVASDARTSSVIVSDIDENLERVEKLVASIDIPPTQVLIEGKIIEASDQFERQFGINWNASGKQISVGSQNLNMPIQVNPPLGAATFNFNPSFGTLDVLGDLNANLRLYEREGSVKVLSSPRIVTLHNEAATISQTVSVPIVSTTPATTGAPLTSVTYKEAKLSLGVTPNVTNDGGVIMIVDVNREFFGEASDSTGNRPLNTRTAKTKVLIRNGQTAVIGGIYQNDTTDIENRVPGLGNLPLVGWLFKTKAKDNRRNELLIFLTPKIIAQATPSLELKKGEL